MLKYPNISPVIFQIGPIALRWYGLMYAISFLVLLVVMRRKARQGFLPLGPEAVERLFIYMVLSLIVGARLFYVIFYGGDVMDRSSGEVLAIWHGGLSFHGGLAGVALVSFLYARYKRIPWFSLTDTFTLVAPVGLGLGRIGNFINGELFGRVTTVPWGMVFPTGGPLPRHPSQLYESFLEGLVLGLFLLWLSKRVKHHGIVSGAFMVGYAIIRIFVEFFREPDVQLGYVLGPFTMGQLLSAAILIPGAMVLWYAARNGALIGAQSTPTAGAAPARKKSRK